MRYRRQEFEDLCKAADVLTKIHNVTDMDNIQSLYVIGNKIIDILNEEYEYEEEDDVPEGETE